MRYLQSGSRHAIRKVDCSFDRSPLRNAVGTCVKLIWDEGLHRRLTSFVRSTKGSRIKCSIHFARVQYKQRRKEKRELSRGRLSSRLIVLTFSLKFYQILKLARRRERHFTEHSQTRSPSLIFTLLMRETLKTFASAMSGLLVNMTFFFSRISVFQYLLGRTRKTWSTRIVVLDGSSESSEVRFTAAIIHKRFSAGIMNTTIQIHRRSRGDVRERGRYRET